MGYCSSQEKHESHRVFYVQNIKIAKSFPKMADTDSDNSYSVNVLELTLTQ